MIGPLKNQKNLLFAELKEKSYAGGCEGNPIP